MSAQFVQGGFQAILNQYFRNGTAPVSFQVGLATNTTLPAANSVLGLFDSAGYNTTVSLGAPTTIFTAASGTTLKGIDFAPVPEPKTWVMIGIGSWFMLWNVRRRRNLVG